MKSSLTLSNTISDISLLVFGAENELQVSCKAFDLQVRIAKRSIFQMIDPNRDIYHDLYIGGVMIYIILYAEPALGWCSDSHNKDVS